MKKLLVFTFPLALLACGGEEQNEDLATDTTQVEVADESDIPDFVLNLDPSEQVSFAEENLRTAELGKLAISFTEEDWQYDQENVAELSSLYRGLSVKMENVVVEDLICEEDDAGSFCFVELLMGRTQNGEDRPVYYTFFLEDSEKIEALSLGDTVNALGALESIDVWNEEYKIGDNEEDMMFQNKIEFLFHDVVIEF